MVIEDIVEAVKANGARTYDAGELRDAYGVDRLGRLVREGISSALAGEGITHWPKEIPQYQDEPVRLFHIGSPTGELIAAVLQPSEANDERIAAAVDSDNADILIKVKQLVCD